MLISSPLVHSAKYPAGYIYANLSHLKLSEIRLNEIVGGLLLFWPFKLMSPLTFAIQTSMSQKMVVH